MIELAAACECRAEGRTLSGAAMRYGDVAPGFRELFEPGAFESRADPLPLNLQHDGGLVLATTADRLTVADSAAVLSVRADMAPDGAAMTLVRSGSLSGLSVGFVATREHRADNGLRVIERAHLDHIALVDRPAFPGSTIEVRARSFRSFRSYVPRERRVRCECSGPSAKFARMVTKELDSAMDNAFAAAEAEIDEGLRAEVRADADAVAVFGDYSRPLASVSRGTLRRDGRFGIEIDVPDDDNGRAAVAAHESAGVVVRPFLAPVDGGPGPDIKGDEAIWRHPFRIRAFVVSSTDAREGWPTPELVATGDAAERSAPDRRLALL